MRFAIYSEVGAQSIRENLGRPEYSYYFVLSSFLPALERIGSVDYVRDPATDLDRIFAENAARGEDCLFISFSPPHKAFIDHDHPMIVVFAWEFSTIPNEIWDNEPRNDWRTVFARNGRAITLSSHTARAVKDVMGPDFPILAVAAPVWDRFELARSAGLAGPIIAETELRLEGLVLDSRTLDLSPDYLMHPEPPIPEPPMVEPEPIAILVEPEPEPELEPPPPEPEPAVETVAAIEIPAAEPEIPPPQRKTLRYRLGITKRFALEWYREVVRDLLPRWLVWIVSRMGRVTYRLARRLLRSPPPRPSDPDVVETPPITEDMIEEILPPEPEQPEPEPVLAAEAEAEPEIVEVAAVEPPAPPPAPRWPEAQVTLSGVVYTSVLNPTDGRKNLWDLITGFCWAFRDNEDATLVLKMVNRDLGRWYRQYIQMLSQLSPFKCRVVALHGYLDQGEYEKLIAATSYYVNVSGCEGLCLPLMEFMSCGKPAIAPRHTAMEDYIDKSNAFTLDYWVEHNVWPHDTRNLFRTERLRLDWVSVRDAYRESYEVAKTDPARYRAKAEAALRTMRDYSAEDVVAARLDAFLKASNVRDDAQPFTAEAAGAL